MVSEREKLALECTQQGPHCADHQREPNFLRTSTTALTPYVVFPRNRAVQPKTVIALAKATPARDSPSTDMRAPATVPLVIEGRHSPAEPRPTIRAESPRPTVEDGPSPNHVATHPDADMDEGLLDTSPILCA